MSEGMHLPTTVRERAIDAVRDGIPKSTIAEAYGVGRLTIYRWLEREYYEIDEATREAWLNNDVPKIRRAVRKHRAILYFQDESNVSLTAFLGKTRAPRGQTPRSKVTGKRGGVAALSALSRRENLLFRLLEKRIASAQVILLHPDISVLKSFH